MAALYEKSVLWENKLAHTLINASIMIIWLKWMDFIFQWQPCWSKLINVRNKQILFQALIFLLNNINPVHEALSVSHTPVCLQPWTAIQQSNRSNSKRPIVLRVLDHSGSLFCIQFRLCSEFARTDRWVEMNVLWPFTYHLPHLSDCYFPMIPSEPCNENKLC